MVTLNADIQANNIVDVLLMAATYNVANPIISNYVGTGTLMSGALKMGAGIVLNGKGGKIGNIASGALVFAGANDIVGPFMGGLMGSGSTASATKGW